MKRLALFAILFAFAAIGCVSVRGNVSVSDSPGAENNVLRHVVFFKFNPGTSDADIEKVRTAFQDLKNGIPTVRSIECGANVSPENLNQGFTHCFIVTFDDAQGRDTYLTHPVHQEFVKLAGPFLEQAMVIDFVPQR